MPDQPVESEPCIVEEFKDTRSQGSVGSQFRQLGFAAQLAKNQQEDQDLHSFFQSERHYLIMTNAGKPVYSMNGDIYQLSPIFATIYAIISKTQTYAFSIDRGVVAPDSDFYGTDTLKQRRNSAHKYVRPEFAEMNHVGVVPQQAFEDGDVQS